MLLPWVIGMKAASNNSIRENDISSSTALIRIIAGITENDQVLERSLRLRNLSVVDPTLVESKKAINQSFETAGSRSLENSLEIVSDKI